MAKKKKNSEGFFESVEAEILREAGEHIKEKIKKKAIRIGEMSLAFLFAFVLIIIGVAQFLGTLVPYLDNGLNYLLLGVLFLIIGLILK